MKSPFKRKPSEPKQEVDLYDPDTDAKLLYSDHVWARQKAIKALYHPFWFMFSKDYRSARFLSMPKEKRIKLIRERAWMLTHSQFYQSLPDIAKVKGRSNEISAFLNSVAYHILKDPEALKANPIPPPKVFLVKGEPGSGKSFLVKAAMKEAFNRALEAGFVLDLIPFEAAAVNSQWMGVFSGNVRAAFENAQKKPTFMWVDEATSLLKKGAAQFGDSASKEYEGAEASVLQALDNIMSSPVRTIVVLGSNTAESIREDIRRRCFPMDLDTPGLEHKYMVEIVKDNLVKNDIQLDAEQVLYTLEQSLRGLGESKMVPHDITRAFDEVVSESVRPLREKYFTKSTEDVQRKPVTLDSFKTVAIKVRQYKEQTLTQAVQEAEQTVPPSERYSNVGGLDGIKDEVIKEVTLSLHPTLGGDKWIPPRGYLFYGPPGTGKTLLTKAIAGENKVPMFLVKAASLMTGLVGESEKSVRQIFARARSKAPSIIFMDELDAIGHKRGTSLGGNASVQESMLNSLLAELDGFNPKGQIVFIGATNMKDSLDPALLERLDKQYEFCVDSNVQALTHDGWKHYKDLEAGEEIASFEPRTETMVWTELKSINSFPFSGQMVQLKNQNRTIQMTPHHRNLIRGFQRGKTWRGRNLSDKWEFKEYEFLPDRFVIPVGARYIEGRLGLSSSEIRLMGWILTEGWMSYPKTTRGRASLSFCQSETSNFTKCKMIRETLRESGTKFSEYRRERNGTNVTKKRAVEIVWRLSTSEQKLIPYFENPRLLLELPYNGLKELFETMILGDGHEYRNGAIVFTQNKSKVREMFIELCFRLGYRTTTNGMYVSVSKSNTTEFQGKEKKRLADYSGTVWCPTTENGIWIARDGEQIFVTGNSLPKSTVEKLDVIKAQWADFKSGSEVSPEDILKLFLSKSFSPRVCADVIKEAARMAQMEAIACHQMLKATDEMDSAQQAQLKTTFAKEFKRIQSRPAFGKGPTDDDEFDVMQEYRHIAEINPINMDHLKMAFDKKAEPEDVKDMRRYSEMHRSRDPQIGVTYGLATDLTEQYGLFATVECEMFRVSMPHKNNEGINCLGSPGKGIFESAFMARDLIRKYNPDIMYYDIDIHFISLGEGTEQIAASGPSAGQAILFSMISAFLQEKASADVCMTGKTDFKGIAGIVGGIQPKRGAGKLDAARENNFKYVLIPEEAFKELQKDWQDYLDNSLANGTEIRGGRTFVEYSKLVFPGVQDIEARLKEGRKQ